MAYDCDANTVPASKIKSWGTLAEKKEAAKNIRHNALFDLDELIEKYAYCRDRLTRTDIIASELRRLKKDLICGKSPKSLNQRSKAVK